MAIPASEYRKRLLARGCDEDAVDVIMALASAVHDYAAAEVIMKAGEQTVRSEQMLIQQLNGQLKRNEQRYCAVDSALCETARIIKALIEQHPDESPLDFNRILLAVTGMQTKNVDRYGAENRRLHAELTAAHGRLRAEQEARTEKSFRKFQRSLLWSALGLGGLIIAATIIIIAVMAFLT